MEALSHITDDRLLLNFDASSKYFLDINLKNFLISFNLFIYQYNIFSKCSVQRIQGVLYTLIMDDSARGGLTLFLLVCPKISNVSNIVT